MNAVAAESSFELEDRQSRALVRELHTPRPAIFWTDLLVTAAVGWMAAAAAYRQPLWALLAIPALYRGLCFMHEISHIKRSALKGFEPVWNLLIGFPLLMPSFFYVGVHQYHHSLGSYATDGDPEYLPFSRSNRMTVVFALESFLMPLALTIRFLIMAPAGLLIPPFQRWLVRHASALTMNFRFTREVTPELLWRVRRDSAVILLLWTAAAMLLPWRAFAVWFGIVSVVSFVNTLRTLAAHRYEGSGDPFDRGGQLRDSIDVPGGPWTELWAPVGLRYHALHHYFPGIPYHNLPEAHRRLMAALAGDSVYRGVGVRGLRTALGSLYVRGSRLKPQS